jgi:hypothetical protein
MKKTVATILASLMITGAMVGAAATPAAAAPYHPVPPHHVLVVPFHHVMRPPVVVVHHPRHWREHEVCKVTFHNHHRTRVCIWVPDHR